ncbi:MAG: tRNA (guanosine(37)-N1)-methyltransferase TrmD [Patescibacteria group bacterium]|nr:tRNA (guanosine(37)-N1)-methyltransferase TrmD [Patescibacteria group bacterium]
MKIDILTIFPKMFNGPFNQSMVKKAQDKDLVEINIHNLRKWSKDKHKTVDDKPFGGGAGMVMKVDVIDRALRELFSGSSTNSSPQRSGLKGLPSRTDLNLGSPVKESPLASKTDLSTAKVIFLTPQGKPYKQKKAKELSRLNHIIFICGHYEGIDERIREKFVDEEISIGDYVLTGGEIPVMVVVDSLVRLIPSVLGNDESINDESFSEVSGSSTNSSASIKVEPSLVNTRVNTPQTRGFRKGFNLITPSRTDFSTKIRNPLLLEYPQYTRPAEYKGMKVPKILLSGHHKEIKEWRKKQSIKRTKKVRPDLV